MEGPSDEKEFAAGIGGPQSITCQNQSVAVYGIDVDPQEINHGKICQTALKLDLTGQIQLIAFQDIGAVNNDIIGLPLELMGIAPGKGDDAFRLGHASVVG